MTDKPIKIVAVCGSVREGNFTMKALKLVADEINKSEKASCEILDPSTLDLPLPGTNHDHPDAVKLREMLKDATGIVLATPEYHGSYSSVIKLVIENLGFPSELSGKPLALLGVAAGRIGAIKATEHLRSVCSHVGAYVLPGPISVALVQSVFDEDGNCTDPELEKAIRSVGLHLVGYIQDNICPRVALEAMVRRSK